MKVVRSICLDEDVIKDIAQQRKLYSFDFSAWVNTIYRSQFLSPIGVMELIKAKGKEIEELNARLEVVKKRAEEIGKIFNKNELNFILKVPLLIREGKESQALWRRFNNDFNKDLDYAEFQQLVRQYCTVYKEHQKKWYGTKN